jgi:hypothetical protein
LRQQVATESGIDDIDKIDLEDVFMALTGKSVEDDEEEATYA